MSLNRLAVLSLAALPLVAAGCGRDTNVKFEPTSLELRDNSSTAVSESDLPADVADVFRRQHPQASITRIEQRKYLRGQTYYRIHFTTQDGQTAKADYNADPAM